MKYEGTPTVDELFAKASLLAGDDRSRYLGTWCPDPTLRAELEELLRCHDAAGDFLEVPPMTSVSEGASRAEGAEERGAVPGRVGKYVIERELGVGGMGRVYLGRSEQPRRRVALKVVRSGFGSSSVRRRFEQETQVVALLQHPGIAQLFEAGTAEVGNEVLPYFAMEYVDGPTLTEHANRAGLGVRGKLELMARVCDAVEHAHRRGVVHRDLKPGNILVDPSGQPKVLDFGVARLTDAEACPDGTLHTQAGQLIGTLAYMSPEQVGGGAGEVDARADVYALGVMLYELLAGELPLDVRSRPIPEAVRMVREDAAPSLGARDRALRGDIETIVSKALEKDPARRYGSAEELGADIRRHLADEPIAARPPGAWYQLTKFARRNKALVGGTASAVLALTAGLVVALWQAGRADALRVEAERNLATARQINTLLEGIFAAPDPEMRLGRDVTVMAVMDRLAPRMEQDLADQPEVRAAMHRTIASTYRSLGDFAKAEPHAREAVRLHESTLGAEHRETILSWNELAGLLEERGRLDEARAIGEHQWGVAQRVLPETDGLRLASGANLAGVLLDMGEWEEAERLLRGVLAVRERSLPADAPQLLGTRNTLGRLLARTGRLKEAEAMQRGAVEAFKESGRELDPDSFGVLLGLANTLLDLNKFDEADELATELLEGGAAFFTMDQNPMLAARNVRAQVMLKSGRAKEAEQEYIELLSLHERLQLPASAGVVRMKNNLGEALRVQGRLDEAEREFRDALKILDDAGEPPDRARIGLLNNLATTIRLQRRYTEAGTIYEEMIGLSERLLPPDDWMRGLGLYGHGVVMLASRKPEEAEARFTQAYELLLKSHDEGDAAVITVMRSFVNLYELWQKPEKAAFWREKLPAQYRD